MYETQIKEIPTYDEDSIGDKISYDGDKNETEMPIVKVCHHASHSSVIHHWLPLVTGTVTRNFENSFLSSSVMFLLSLI